MATITLHTENTPDYLYPDEWKEYVCEDFNNKVALFGNRDYISIESAPFWDIAVRVFNALNYYGADEFKENYSDELSEELLTAAVKAYDEWNGDGEYSFKVRLARLLNPDIELETATIRGYTQSEWQYVIFVKGCLSVDELGAYFFGQLCEVHIEDGDEDFWDHLTHDRLWKMENGGNLKEELRKYFDISPDEDLRVLKFSGFTQVAKFEEV